MPPSRRKFFGKRANRLSFLHLALAGTRVIVGFSYAPELVTAIKQIAGVRFYGEEKTWSIPLGELDALLGHVAFRQIPVAWGFKRELIESVDWSENARAAAVDRLKADPFAVKEEDILLLRPEAILRCAHNKPSVRIVVGPQSKVCRIAEKIPGVHFVKRDASYFIPVTEVSRLVKELRDKGISFAVESNLGERLKETAIIRSQVIKGEIQSTAQVLSQTLLTPFIDIGEGEDREPIYNCSYFTGEQLGSLVPKGALARSKHGAIQLSRNELNELRRKLRSAGHAVWFTSQAAADLQSTSSHIREKVEKDGGAFDEDILTDWCPEFCWMIAPAGGAVLACSLEIADSMKPAHLAAGIRQLDERPFEDRILFKVSDSKLMDIPGIIDRWATVRKIQTPLRSRKFEERLEEVQHRLELTAQIRTFEALKDISLRELPHSEQLDFGKLFPHQRVALGWLRKTPYAFLGDDMGLGKTLTVLSYFASLKVESDDWLLLVICPASLVRNWQREAKQWYPQFETQLIAGDKVEKSWALRLMNQGVVRSDVLAVNYEAIRLDYIFEGLKQLVKQRRVLLCIDESQRIKNPKSKTYKALAKLSGACERRVLLSGTPTPKDISDIWAQMQILDGGKRFGKSYYRWLGTVAELGTKFSAYSVKRFIPEEIQETIERVQEVLLRRTKDKVINLPEKTFMIRDVELTGDQKNRYDEIRRELLVRLRSASGEQFTRELTSTLEQYLRAVQIASNPRLLDPEWKGDPAKFLELDEIIHEVVEERDEKIVIWTNYLLNVDELTTRYKRFGAAAFSGSVKPSERELIVKRFQNESEPKVLVAVPAAGGVGITLTAAQTAVYVDRTWNAEHWMQSIDRIHRIGQTGTVSVICLHSSKVDEIIHYNLSNKQRGQAELLGDVGKVEIAANAYPSREELIAALEFSD